MGSCFSLISRWSVLIWDADDVKEWVEVAQVNIAIGKIQVVHVCELRMLQVTFAEKDQMMYTSVDADDEEITTQVSKAKNALVKIFIV